MVIGNGRIMAWNFDMLFSIIVIFYIYYIFPCCQLKVLSLLFIGTRMELLIYIQSRIGEVAGWEAGRWPAAKIC